MHRPPTPLAMRDLNSFHVNGLHVAATYEPAEERGGDFYAVISKPPHDTAVILGDVCGRGQAAASFAERLLPDLRTVAQRSQSPRDFLRNANAVACELLPEHVFATAMVLWVRRDSTVTIANAGHVPTILRDPVGGVKFLGQLTGTPLGIFSDAEYVEDTVSFNDGSTLVLMTDGVLEAIEDGSRLIDMPRLASMISAQGSDIENLVSRLLGSVYRRRDSSDDVTLLTLRRSKQPSLNSVAFEAFAGAQ